MRFRVGLASTAGILSFGVLVGAYFIHNEYRYRLAAVESEIKKAAYFLVPQASMLLIQNDESMFLTFTRIVERIASKNHFAYVEIADVKGAVKVPLDPMGIQTSHSRTVSEGPWGALAFGQDYLIREQHYKDAGNVIEGVFGVLEKDKILGTVVLGVSKKPIEDALRKSALTAVALLLALLFLSAALSFNFARKATEPVARLTEAVESFRSSGDLEVFSIDGPHEVSVLASSLRGALGKIQLHQQEIETAITEIKASEGKAKQEMKIVSDSFRKLSKHLKLEEALATILEDIVRGIVYCHEAYILLKVAGDGALLPAEPRPGVDPAPPYVVYPRTHKSGIISHDLLDAILNKGELEVVPDVKRSVWRGKIYGNARSCAIYPLFSAQNVPLGVLFLGMVSETPFNPEELATLRGVMEPIGIAFDRMFLYSQVERLAIHDSMTGLMNHHNVRERLFETLKVAQRQNRPVYVAMADIDKFKAVNDTHGHPVGDQVIRSFAGIIQKSMRAGEYAGRYGGEEFLIVLGPTDLEGARMFAERILKETRSARIALGEGKTVGYTASMGIAAFPADGGSLDQVIEKADEALYAAKQGGRDKYEIWKPESKQLRIL